MTSSRDSRNWSKGYQEALLDIYKAILRGGEEDALQWIRDNNGADTKPFEDALATHFEDIDETEALRQALNKNNRSVGFKEV